MLERRPLFPGVIEMNHQAGWRIGLTLLFTMLGMALGGWLAGALYDRTGDYSAAFLMGIGFNGLNLLLAVWLLMRAWRVQPGTADTRISSTGGAR